MKLNNIGYLLKEGFRSIFQHGFMSFAAICVTVACLIIVGSFSALAYNLDIMVQDLNKEKAVSGKRNENCMQPVKQWAAGGTGISGVGSKMRRDEVQKAWISVKRSA